MLRIASVRDLERAVAEARAAGRTIALVPTMGALHRGHLSLVERARKDGHLVILDVFVNPAQFGPGEDLDRYPRDLEGDARMCEAAGVDFLFHPEKGEVYREGHCTWIEVGKVASGLCGRFRPGHFRGVATVVVKLLGMARPDAAYFGRKDFQQLRVIEAAVRDLDVPVEIVGCPTMRDPDGLAMSSRNAYLSAAERASALAIPLALSEAVRRWAAGERVPDRLAAGLRERIEAAADSVDYIEVVDSATLAELDRGAPARGNALLAVAARVGRTRLIDNVELGVDPEPIRRPARA